MVFQKNLAPGAGALYRCVGWMLAGLSWCASAQVPDLESVQRANQRAIREAQDRPLPQADVFTSPSALPADAPPTPDEVQSAPCLNVASIELLGHLPALGSAPVLPRTPLCLDTPGLNSLLGRLNAHYQAGGWITTRVYVDPVEHTPGLLRLRVLPGQIEQIVLGGDPTDARKNTAFPAHADQLLNLRDLEQGLENINRVPSQEGKFNLRPGSRSGASSVQVDLKESRRYRLTEMLDNSGTRAMGQWKSTTELAIDNPTQHNDQLALGVIANLDRGDLDARFRGLTLNYFVPNGYHLFSLAGSAIRTSFTLPGINTSYPMDTRADKLGMGYEYLFSRDQNSKYSLTAGLDLTRQRTEIADIEVPSQERRLTVLNLGLKGKWFVGQQSHEWVLRAERGLKALNAQTTILDGSDPQYHLLKLRLASLWPLPNNQGLFRTLFQAQAAPKNIPTLAQIYVGGRYDVRGYQQNSLYAPSGAFVRTEYEAPAVSWAGERWNFYVGMDAGRVQTLPNRPLSQQHLIGGALGVRGEAGPWRLELARARAVSRPLQFANEARDRWYAQISLVY